MENVEEIHFYGSIYDEIIRQAIRNFEATLNFFDELHQFNNFQTEPDLGYESGNELDIDEPDNNVKGDLQTTVHPAIESRTGLPL
jgi:hypothetical protein